MDHSRNLEASFVCHYSPVMSRNSDWLRAGRLEFDSPFSLLRRTKTGSEGHPVSYTVGTAGSFLGGKAAGGVKLSTHHHVVPLLLSHVSISSSQRLFGSFPCTSTSFILLLFSYMFTLSISTRVHPLLSMSLASSSFRHTPPPALGTNKRHILIHIYK
jgi:hypothetical protein